MTSSIASARRVFTTRQGLSLVADEVGPIDGRVVLFLHGGGQTRSSWGAAVADLGRAGYRAVTLDQRGHGESSWSSDKGYDYRLFAQDIGDVLHQLAPGAILVGASLGGIASLAAVGSGWDNQAAALILVDVVPRINEEGSNEILSFMTANRDGFASVEEAADAVAAYLPHRPRPKDVSGLRRNLRERGDGRLYWHWDPAMMDVGERIDREAIRLELEQAARQVAIPTLLIRGARSRIVTEQGAEELKQLIPHAEYVNVADAHHMVAGDVNDAFAAPLLDFLGRNSICAAHSHSRREK